MRGFIIVGLLLITAAGCQCCSFTERYQDGIDHIADHEHPLDRFYIEALDLTRLRCGRCSLRRCAPKRRYCETQQTIPTIAQAKVNVISKDPDADKQSAELDQTNILAEHSDSKTPEYNSSTAESEVQLTLFESTPKLRQEKPLKRSEIKRKPIEAPQPVSAPLGIKPKPKPPVF